MGDVQDVYPKLSSVTLYPSYEGEPAEFTISPALPAGLSIDAATGTIQGSPSEIKPKTTYKVTAKNETGSCDTELAFSVEVLPPSDLHYDRIDDTYNIGEVIAELAPTLQGGADEFKIEPPLPPGMSFDTKTGIITGKPTEKVAQTDYTVTAINEGGGTSCVITFAVVPLPPRDLKYSPQTPYNVNQPVLLVPDTTNCVSCAYTITPNLPDGLSIEPDTGTIAGTPTAETAEQTYTVTAKNDSGETSAAFPLTIDAPAGENYVDPNFCIKI